MLEAVCTKDTMYDNKDNVLWEGIGTSGIRRSSRLPYCECYLMHLPISRTFLLLDEYTSSLSFRLSLLLPCTYEKHATL